MLDRRGFLRNTAGGAAALAAATLISPGCAAEYPQAEMDGVALQTLTPKQYAVVRAAAEALLVDVPVSPAEVAASVDRELALVGDPIEGDMKAVLGLIEHLTILGGRLRRFTALSPEARLRYLGTWRESRFKLRRAAFMALRAVVYYTAYTHDSTRPLTGFEGPWPERYRIPVYPVDFGEVV
ncbi:MAG TPA: twin-arginine translocation signal domain-containing protein [Longimicrobiales bacterium]|nr:twin-arginine translocation signal domain-containing protein [Longimicrobiales bacterium]